MAIRVETLTAKYCLRYNSLPPDSLLHLLASVLHTTRYASDLSKSPLFCSLPPDPLAKDVRAAIQTARVAHYNSLIPKQVLLKACRPPLGVDPILYLPSTRLEKRRMLRWRLNWLPGTPCPCPCGTDETKRRHFPFCPEIPQTLWQSLPPHPEGVNPLDHALSSLPKSSKYPCAYWQPILAILLLIERLCWPNLDFPDEDSGSIWTSSLASRLPTPSPAI
ncbi:hypothetical protein BJ085DRAFT_13436 [Dimargaris cristalligena]|uniref:Uncharacterized protein n=1 Tax=Dimargaris cristalligena TaxID=215637 RepID=A0A4P9ZJE4_9FUNG|nr:hypothetical protein BJ085DRAFT_13436 [Dimargaris cristalligena]|eukprot:RKP33148.1 hypothetical protein BJ085DRAFT_13436 [Dimargaris cristalligena]